MDISTLLSGAGQVSTGVREREDELRRAREDQLRLEALNRQNRARQIDTQATVAPAPDFGPLRPRQDVGVAPTYLPAPAAPTAPAGVRVKPAENPTTTVGKVPAAAPAPTEPPPMTQAEFMALSPAERARRLQIINDQRRINQGAAGAYYALSPIYDIGAAPINAAAWAVEKGANAVGWPRLGRALGIYGPEVNEVTVPRIGDGSLAPMAGDELRRFQANTPLTEEQYLETLPATNAPGRRGGSYRARQKNKAGGLELPDAAMQAEGFETQRAADRYTKLTNGLPAALQNPQTQQIMSRAQALGVDPVAAVTVFGIETTYGANANTSGKGAKGAMQVTDETFAAMKRWFSDPASSPNATPAQRAAAAALDPGNSQSWIDAGLLRLAYNEQVGVPKELWGAAYQAPAEKVRDKGAPINASDGHFTNSEYHSVFVNLYNQVANALSGLSPVATAEAAPVGDVSGAAIGQGGGSGVIMPVARGAVAAPGTQTSPAQFYLSNPQAIGRDVRMAQQQRDELVRMAQMYQQSGMGDEYRQVRQAIMALDNQTANLIGIQAVQEMEFANDPTRLSQMLSYVQGQQIDLKPYNNGTFDIIINGVTAHKNVPGAKIKDDALSLFDPQYVAQKTARAQETHKQNLETQRLLQGKYADLVRELLVAQQNGMSQVAVERLKRKNITITPSGDGITTFIQTPDGLFTYNSAGGGTMEIDGETIPLSNLQRIAGVNVGD